AGPGTGPHLWPGGDALTAVDAALRPDIDLGSPAVAQLAETSDLVADLRRRPVPADVHLLSIAARGDWVVAAPDTEVAGATNVTVPVHGLGAHGDLVASDAATAELARALAGRPPGCESVGDVVADVLVGHGIESAEDAAGLALLVSGP
ncbi:MAG TPA: hypothetical protein VF743_03580, partial [Acidimicrobiales bacterium]